MCCESRAVGRLAMAAAVLAALLLPASARAGPFIVTSTAAPTAGVSCAPAAPNNCTLREAIIEANATPAVDDIKFSIGGGGPQLLTVNAFLRISQPVRLDATSQPGYDSTTGVPLIEIKFLGPAIAGLLF